MTVVRVALGNAVHPRNSDIDGVVSGEITALVAGLDVDSVLTSGRAELSENVRRLAQEALHALNAGVSLTGVELT